MQEGAPEVRADLFAWSWHTGRTQSGDKCGRTLGRGGAVLVHVWTNDVDKKGSEDGMGRYRELVRELKRVRVGQIALSGVIPVRVVYTRNNRRISINLRMQAMCQKEGAGVLNMWEHFPKMGYI